jgi:hypothetical protein
MLRADCRYFAAQAVVADSREDANSLMVLEKVPPAGPPPPPPTRGCLMSWGAPLRP